MKSIQLWHEGKIVATIPKDRAAKYTRANFLSYENNVYTFTDEEESIIIYRKIRSLMVQPSDIGTKYL